MSIVLQSVVSDMSVVYLDDDVAGEQWNGNNERRGSANQDYKHLSERREPLGMSDHRIIGLMR